MEEALEEAVREEEEEEEEEDCLEEDGAPKLTRPMEERAREGVRVGGREGGREWRRSSKAEARVCVIFEANRVFCPAKSKNRKKITALPPTLLLLPSHSKPFTYSTALMPTHHSSSFFPLSRLPPPAPR